MEHININEDEIRELLANKSYEEIRKVLGTLDPADIADTFEELDSIEQKQLFIILDEDVSSEILSEISSEDIDDIVDVISPEKLAAILEDMAQDDAADIYKHLNPDKVASINICLDRETQQKLRVLAGYEDDSAGGLMTPEFCAVSSQTTVQKAISFIAEGEFTDPISMIFIVDKSKILVGCIWISDLLTKKKSSSMEEVMDQNIIYSEVDEDQEDIARRFRKYDLYAMPVVNSNKELVGRITVDDVVDVIYEEANEDYGHMAGAPDIERHEESPLQIVRLRLPWLLITMFAGLIISVIVHEIANLGNAESLAIFVPAIMAMGGNTGMQSSAVAIRRIALENSAFDKLLNLFFRELSVGVLMGLVCGISTGVIVYFSVTYFGADTTQTPFKLSSIVGVSMCVAMTFAAAAGAIIPILLHRFKIDPAVASGPFITTGNDVAASLIYFIMCMSLLG